jgi:hypothetical protein
VIPPSCFKAEFVSLPCLFLTLLPREKEPRFDAALYFEECSSMKPGFGEGTKIGQGGRGSLLEFKRKFQPLIAKNETNEGDKIRLPGTYLFEKIVTGELLKTNRTNAPIRV